MISVTVKIHPSFQRVLSQVTTREPFDVLLQKGTTVEQLLRDKIVSLMEIPKLILVNGSHAEKGQLLKDGDRVSLFSPVAGG